ncbi:hypothetical protein J6590_005204 [Homalodisca vitripennis]|nr:hypothetical protein J6590_005204 [Homalodisca vitripennis]
MKGHSPAPFCVAGCRRVGRAWVSLNVVRGYNLATGQRVLAITQTTCIANKIPPQPDSDIGQTDNELPDPAQRADRSIVGAADNFTGPRVATRPEPKTYVHSIECGTVLG